MENYNIEDVVMIYGHKAIIESIQNVENVKSEIQPNKIYVGKYVNKKGYSDGTYRKKKIYTPQNDELVILCSYNSIKPYNEEESACTMIQKMFRGYQGRKSFHSFVCCTVWRKFDHIHEYITLNNHEYKHKKERKKKGEDDKGEDIKGEDIKGEDIKRDEKNNKTTEDKINTLKKRTCDIENSNRKKNKTSSSIKDIINMDEEYLKNMKKYNKMSKKEREKLAYEYEDVKKNMVDTMEREKKNSYHSKYKTEILGDVHGQLHDVLWLFNRFGIPSSTNMLVKK
ncbi:hypothetical protein PFFCH_05647 [Plasmodium falciparum FCH/4]|uniref:Serine/threonine specific protein phosphatases domain-containing protein n=1 Tax=Plasmodium falciparum FCH/4 TaxID=1036724 RepID=A0A024VFA1_PLAFA|nr:hypothetical protein PFFCH_05647 [Plasmodium falciparum FCH/4]